MEDQKATADASNTPPEELASAPTSNSAASTDRAGAAKALMEEYNVDAAEVSVWMRTERHGPSQRPWFADPMGDASLIEPSSGHEAANKLKPVPHQWRWKDLSPFVDKMAGIADEAGIEPMEFADRQSIMFMNPGLGGRLQVTNTLRGAISVYNPGDDAPAHVHSPNATRIILSDEGGYTNIEGERCDARRGDIILTPNGTWHHHGNDGDSPVVWLDTLDWPLLEYLDATWIDKDYRDSGGAPARVQSTAHGDGYSSRLYGHGGMRPTFSGHERGFGQSVTPMFHYKGDEIRQALHNLRDEPGDPYEGIQLELVNPANGESIFPTMRYTAQLLRPGEATRPKRETSSSYFVVIEGEGFSEVGGTRFEWARNDVVAIPGFIWRRHINTGTKDAILYNMSDAALFANIGQYRAQGIAGSVVELTE